MSKIVPPNLSGPYCWFPTAQEPIKMLCFGGWTAQKHLPYNKDGYCFVWPTGHFSLQLIFTFLISFWAQAIHVLYCRCATKCLRELIPHRDSNPRPLNHYFGILQVTTELRAPWNRESIFRNPVEVLQYHHILIFFVETNYLRQTLYIYLRLVWFWSHEEHTLDSIWLRNRLLDILQTTHTFTVEPCGCICKPHHIQ